MKPYPDEVIEVLMSVKLYTPKRYKSANDFCHKLFRVDNAEFNKWNCKFFYNLYPEIVHHKEVRIGNFQSVMDGIEFCKDSI